MEYKCPPSLRQRVREGKRGGGEKGREVRKVGESFVLQVLFQVSSGDVNKQKIWQTVLAF